MTQRIVDLLEPVEVDHQQRAGPFGIAIGLEQFGQTPVHPVAVGQTGNRIVLRQPFGIAPVFPAGRDILRATAIAGKALLLVELRFARDFPPDFAPLYGETDIELADRVARPQQERERALWPVGIIDLLGDEEFAQRFADRFALRPVELFRRIVGQVDEPAFGIGRPEPAQTCGLETVEQFHPAFGIGDGDRTQRRRL